MTTDSNQCDAASMQDNIPICVNPATHQVELWVDGTPDDEGPVLRWLCDEHLSLLETPSDDWYVFSKPIPIPR
jgi:hypothetical protein